MCLFPKEQALWQTNRGYMQTCLMKLHPYRYQVHKLSCLCSFKILFWYIVDGRLNMWGDRWQFQGSEQKIQTKAGGKTKYKVFMSSTTWGLTSYDCKILMGKWELANKKQLCISFTRKAWASCLLKVLKIVLHSKFMFLP